MFLYETMPLTLSTVRSLEKISGLTPRCPDGVIKEGIIQDGLQTYSSAVEATALP